MLRGWRLASARVVWVAVVLLAAGSYVADLPGMLALVVDPSLPDGFTPEQLAELARLGLPAQLVAAIFAGLDVAGTLAAILVGALLFARKGHEVMAWLVALMLAADPGVDFPPYLRTLLPTEPVRAVIGLTMTAIVIGLFYTLFFLFPSGRFVPRWATVPAALWCFVAVPEFFSGGAVMRYLPHTGVAGALAMLAFVGSALYAQIYRFRRVSGSIERQQTKWFVFGMSSTLLVFGGFNVVLSTGAFGPVDNPSSLLAIMLMNTVVPLSFLAIPISLALAILKHRLFQIDVIISRALVYGTLTLLVVGLYVGVVGYLGVAFRARGSLAISLLATGLVAVLFQPLRERLQRGVNHLVYGERDDPYAALSRLGRRMEETLAPDAVLPAIVETIASALKLPYVAIALHDEGGPALAAAVGTATPELLRLPLVYQSEPVGELHLAARGPGEEFSRADRYLLDDLARQAGVAAHAVRLSAQALRLAEDLQQARSRLVTAREEERRRLRRDLHDGIGPRLASLTMKLETARDRLGDDPSAAAVLTDLTVRMQETVADIRRLVYGLRPPALDDLGLASALREWAESLGQAAGPAGAGLSIAVQAPVGLPALPAAVEVAAYRIAQEALTNVARHARARSATVSLAYHPGEERLTVEIRDDGCGLPPERRAGVGLASMRERAEELGGRLIVESVPGAGTRVLADLPCRWARQVEAAVDDDATDEGWGG